jgi:hypothetical protein
MSNKDDALEEQFVLRCLDPQLAAKLREWLQEKRQLSDVVKLLFQGNSMSIVLSLPINPAKRSLPWI